MKLKYIAFFVLAGILFYGCEPTLEDYNYSSGNADFTTYVALGNSLTAGYADGTLYREGQMNSYPLMLSNQFKKLGGSANFEQPYLTSEIGILPGKLTLGYPTDCLGVTSLGPVPVAGTPEDIVPYGKAVHNLGVPGAKSVHLLAPGYGDFAGIAVGTANPYFARFATSSVTTVLGDAIALQPTFYTLWIGSNDILGYATSGGLGDTITSQQWFAGYMNTIMMTLQATGASGAIANLPDVENSPFFKTVPPNGYVLTQGQADTLNTFLGPFGFTYAAGPNYFIIEDVNSPLGFRQMVEGELLLLTVPQDSLKCAYWGGFNPFTQVQVPIPGQYVLTADEITTINNAVAGYNQTIANMAEQYDIAHVDINGFLKQAESGLIFDGESFNTDFITGNAFSLDGIHLTPKGYALVANQFIEAINKKYGSTVPRLSTAAYRANVVP